MAHAKTKKKEIKKNKNLIITLVSIVVIIIIALILFLTTGTQNNTNTTTQKNISNTITSQTNNFEGDLNAPVTIIEYTDFECPYCTRFFDQTLPSIRLQYIDKGLVRFEVREFPLNNIHKFAQKAAEAAECAGQQNKFIDMYNELYTKGVDGGVASYKSYAKDIGLNTSEFNSCIDNGDAKTIIKSNQQDGINAGVTGTPSFLINGELVIGAQPFTVFKGIIDKKLAEVKSQ